MLIIIQTWNILLHRQNFMHIVYTQRVQYGFQVKKIVYSNGSLVLCVKLITEINFIRVLPSLLIGTEI